jgi:hypothetical protein
MLARAAAAMAGFDSFVQTFEPDGPAWLRDRVARTSRHCHGPKDVREGTNPDVGSRRFHA